MAQFLGDIAFLLELFAVTGGLCLLYLAGQRAGAGLLRLAAYLLIAGGIAGALCTGYYWFKYQAAGDFDRAYPAVMQMMPEGMMKSDMHHRMKGAGAESDMQRGQAQHSMPEAGAGDLGRHERNQPE